MRDNAAGEWFDGPWAARVARGRRRWRGWPWRTYSALKLLQMGAWAHPHTAGGRRTQHTTLLAPE